MVEKLKFYKDVVKYNDDPDMRKLMKEYKLNNALTARFWVSDDWRKMEKEFWERKEDDENF